MELPPPPVQRPVALRASNVLLFLSTFLCMAFSGGTYWDTAPHLLSGEQVGLLPSGLSDFGLRVLAGLPFSLWLIAILGAHEMGHFLACRRYGIPATWPYFLPAPLFMFGTFGAVIRIRGVIPRRRALFDVAFAGPLAGFVVAVAAVIVGVSISVAAPPELESQSGGMVYSLPLIASWLADFLRPGETLTMNGTLAAAWGGFLITVLNLFPAGQLDGGHIAYAVSRRLHRWLSWGAIGLAAATVTLAFRNDQPPVYLIWLGVLLWMRNRHPPLWFEHEPLGRGRRWVALAALVMFVLCFTWAPIRFLD